MTAGPDFRGLTVLVIHAHPDDEVFATGAATIAANHAGARVHLRLFTGGEGRAGGTDPAALAAARRRKEERLAGSIRRLGIDDWAYLAEVGRWTDTPHALEKTIANAPVEHLVTPVVRAIESLRPDVLLTVGPDGLTGHPDHIACHHAVRRALARSTHTVPLAWGSVLVRHAVETARRNAMSTLGIEVGTGRVTGVDLGAAAATVTGPFGTELRRRRALDEYVTGLGTADLANLNVGQIGAGDSVLLRLVVDASGWDRDHFVPIA